MQVLVIITSYNRRIYIGHDRHEGNFEGILFTCWPLCCACSHAHLYQKGKFEQVNSFHSWFPCHGATVLSCINGCGVILDKYARLVGALQKESSDWKLAG